jgi:hypothetical protein
MKHGSASLSCQPWPERLGPLRVVESSTEGACVPRFYFHVRHVTGVLDIDEEGQDLPDVTSAKTEALEAAKELIIEGIRMNQRIDCRFEVAGQDGRVIFVVPFREAIRL